ncbi:Predicted transcription regulator, contains HTH domain, MarR family [Cohaesibacter marisflavi]|uniref:Predicted transcription regulator, contains HTH domain, MarR family n=1 Tax=Cohaesibacter marisflavi TaxID=655353 RepID=A0A1I5KZX3_9HYPH|nr:winged helix DNA-binding protein [Cohaesibacter marisflavi]SFO90453.1 Predicted transcription regulator, contains HTH domain, MarR family [Cohaesibacter marisflavi]
MSMDSTEKQIGPVVAASHLASGAMPALSEVEFALTMMVNAYHRWIERCMAASGTEGLGPLDVIVLHSVNHRGRSKTLSDICLVLNVEDTHTVAYALKKLEKAGLVASGKRGKEKIAEITPAGEDACLEYKRLREALLIKPMKALGLDEKELSQVASTLRMVSGNYDQAARAAAAM